MSELFLLARIAGRRVAIAAQQVESVVDIGEVTPVPLAKSHVRGLTALRSRVVTVVDAPVALGLAEPDRGPASRAVITLVDGHYYALLVEDVEDVALFECAPLASGIALNHGWARVARGVVEPDQEPVLAIDAAALVLPAAA